MIGRFTKTAQRITRDDRGVAIIELAMVAPVLALTVVGIVDLSNAYSRKLALEQGAQRAIEKIMQTTQAQTVDDTLKNEALCQVNGTNANGTCKTSPVTADDVTVTYRLECTAPNGSITVSTGVAAAADCPSGQSEAQYISVQVNGSYTPLFPTRWAGMTGNFNLSATAGMRTQ
jgi:Flp pilus assembly protein TadG